MYWKLVLSAFISRFVGSNPTRVNKLKRNMEKDMSVIVTWTTTWDNDESKRVFPENSITQVFEDFPHWEELKWYHMYLHRSEPDSVVVLDSRGFYLEQYEMELTTQKV
jgi:hypothetical protein